MRQTDRTTNMDRVKLIFFYLSFGLSFILTRGQQIGNYVSNGSFETLNSYSVTSLYISVDSWQATDSVNCPALYLATTRPPFSNSPYAVGFQYARTGDNYIISTFTGGRGYPRNRLKQKLKANTTYCAKYYVVNTNHSAWAIDGFGIYVGNQTLDTIKKCFAPLSYLTPQIQHPNGNIILDTLQWIVISGTFVADGSEKYLMLGNFKTDAATNSILINPTYSISVPFSDICIDDVSCIESNLSAYAGRDTTIVLSDSVYIGRQTDFAIDSGCIWYKLPNMTTPIDTISGLWVKPTTTSTYIVRQQLDCSSLKWDTVVVTVNTNLIGIDKLQWFSDNISLFPNPTSSNLNISFPSQLDIKTFNISNSLGQIVQEEAIEIKNSSCNILTSDLKNGLYQIHFKTQFGIVTKKFVKTN